MSSPHRKRKDSEEHQLNDGSRRPRPFKRERVEEEVGFNPLASQTRNDHDGNSQQNLRPVVNTAVAFPIPAMNEALGARLQQLRPVTTSAGKKLEDHWIDTLQLYKPIQQVYIETVREITARAFTIGGRSSDRPGQGYLEQFIDLLRLRCPEEDKIDNAWLALQAHWRWRMVNSLASSIRDQDTYDSVARMLKTVSDTAIGTMSSRPVEPFQLGPPLDSCQESDFQCDSIEHSLAHTSTQRSTASTTEAHMDVSSGFVRSFAAQVDSRGGIPSGQPPSESFTELKNKFPEPKYLFFFHVLESQKRGQWKQFLSRKINTQSVKELESRWLQNNSAAAEDWRSMWDKLMSGDASVLDGSSVAKMMTYCVDTPSTSHGDATVPDIFAPTTVRTTIGDVLPTKTSTQDVSDNVRSGAVESDSFGPTAHGLHCLGTDFGLPTCSSRCKSHDDTSRHESFHVEVHNLRHCC